MLRYTGWILNVLLPNNLQTVDVLNPSTFTGWIPKVLVPITLHTVDSKRFDFYYVTQGGLKMSYFPPLYTGGTRNALIHITLHRVDLECLTSTTLPTVNLERLTDSTLHLLFSINHIFCLTLYVCKE